MIDSAVIQRLLRIKNLAERAGTAEEAATARAMLDRLIIKYGVSMADLHEAGRSGAIAYGEDKIVLGEPAQWRMELITAVAVTNGCRVLFQRWDIPAVLVGLPHDMIVVRDLYMRLENKLPELLAEEERKERREVTKPRFGGASLGDYIRFNRTSYSEYFDDPSRWRDDFLIGCCVGIFDQLRESREYEERAKTQASPGVEELHPIHPEDKDISDSNGPGSVSRHSLVPLERDARENIDDYINRQYEPASGDRQYRSFGDGYYRGYNIGLRLQLREAIGEENGGEDRSDRNSLDLSD